MKSYDPNEKTNITEKMCHRWIGEKIRTVIGDDVVVLTVTNAFIDDGKLILEGRTR